MPNMRHHFEALLSKVNPPDERVRLASTRVGDLRDWLRDHDYMTEDPHTRLSGSYERNTAIGLIPDVDVLVFVPSKLADRTPNAVLRELHGVLGQYPNAGKVDLHGQRRSVRLELPEDVLCLDLVPAVVESGGGQGLLVPDRSQGQWIASDPLGYARRLSGVNQANGGKLVPLVKLFKAWRDEHLVYRRPKSYVLEVILLYGVEAGDLLLCERSRAENLRDTFEYIAGRYADLMDNGSDAPRIRDPQIPTHYISKGWSRAHFETFMRRIREAQQQTHLALTAQDDEGASEEWRKVFGALWPDPEEVKEAARNEGRSHQPGATRISPTGMVVGGLATVPTRATRFHG